MGIAEHNRVDGTVLGGDCDYEQDRRLNCGEDTKHQRLRRDVGGRRQPRSSLAKKQRPFVRDLSDGVIGTKPSRPQQNDEQHQASRGNEANLRGCRHRQFVRRHSDQHEDAQDRGLCEQ